MKDNNKHTGTWQDITKGSNWRNRKTRSACVVIRPPVNHVDSVGLLHQSGKISTKRVHYFLYDFEKIEIEGEPMNDAHENMSTEKAS